MVACLAIGDGTAIGVADARPGCVAIGETGITAAAFVGRYVSHSPAVDTAIISLGAADGGGQDISESLRRVRAGLSARKVIWLIPSASPLVRLAVARAAATWHDSIIDTRPSSGQPETAPRSQEIVAKSQNRNLPPESSQDSQPALLACGSTVAPSTLLAIMRIESGARPYAINVNGAGVQPPPARSAEEAGAIATAWIAKGYSVDLGLMQVNSRNLASLGYTVAQMFDPCTNIAAGASILTSDYLSAAATRPDPQVALRAALSAYNTGNFERGFFNGYVAKYYGSYAGQPVRIITAAALTRQAAPQVARPVNPFTASMTIFSREASNE